MTDPTAGDRVSGSHGIGSPNLQARDPRQTRPGETIARLRLEAESRLRGAIAALDMGCYVNALFVATEALMVLDILNQEVDRSGAESGSRTEVIQRPGPRGVAAGKPAPAMEADHGSR